MNRIVLIVLSSIVTGCVTLGTAAVGGATWNWGPLMDQKEARGNVRFGLLLTVIAVMMLALAFVWATLYLSSSHVK